MRRCPPARRSTWSSCSAATGRCFAPCGGLLGTGTPVVGANFGTVGFLTSITADALEAGLQRVFAGDYEIAELPTLDIELRRPTGTSASTTS